MLKVLIYSFSWDAKGLHSCMLAEKQEFVLLQVATSHSSFRLTPAHTTHTPLTARSGHLNFRFASIWAWSLSEYKLSEKC